MRGEQGCITQLITLKAKQMSLMSVLENLNKRQIEKARLKETKNTVEKVSIHHNGITKYKQVNHR